MNNHELETDVSELHKVVARLLSDISSLSTLAIKLDGTLARAEEADEREELEELRLDAKAVEEDDEDEEYVPKKRGRGRPRKYVQY